MSQTKQDFDLEFSTTIEYNQDEIDEYREMYGIANDSDDDVFEKMIHDVSYQDMVLENFKYDMKYLLGEVDSEANEWKIESNNVGWDNSSIKPEYVTDANELIDVVVYTDGTVHVNVEDDRLVIKFTHHDSPHISQADTFVVTPQ